MLRGLLEFIAEFRSVFYQAPHMDADGLARLQGNKLADLLRRSLRDTALVRQQWVDSGLDPAQPNPLEAFGNLRTITKQDYLRAPAGSTLSDYYKTEELQTEKSSGTSGNPFTVYFDAHYVLNRNLRFLRGLHATGYHWPMKMLLITGDRDRQSSFWRRWHYSTLKASVQDWYALLQEIRPHVVYGCTTPLRLLAEYIRDNQLPTHLPGITITTAETLDAATRKLLAETFHSEVFDFYGMTEMGLVAWECKAHDGYHLAEDAVLIDRFPVKRSTLPDNPTMPETARPDDSPDKPFRLVYTNMELSAMPFIRYESGDTAYGYSSEPCLCGSRLPRIRRFEGRVIDSIQLPDGTLLSPYRFTCTLEEIPGMKRFRVLQLDATLVRIEIESNPAIDSDTLAEQARRIATTLLPPVMSIDTAVVTTLEVTPGRKFRPVECRISRL
jgi:phenylacetate-CoA ligase